jgi:predicted ATP-grasp superfamily ATP-dependent carboligase
MQNQYPLLIFAQSARFITQSAIRAGYTVRVADCFGDQDLVCHAEIFIRLPPVNEWTSETLLQTIHTLSHGESCELIIGTGLEYCLEALEQLPPHIHYIGNSPTTLRQLRDAATFFKLLDRLKLPHPKTLFSSSTSKKDYLIKNMQSCGGQAVKRANNVYLRSGDFYQQNINGRSASATFIANGRHAELLAINQQFHEKNFNLIGISQPMTVSAHVRHKIKEYISILTQSTSLCGFNSLDVIIDAHDNIFILEVNPRISASVELLLLNDMFYLHKQACDGEVLPSIGQPSRLRQLHTLFADKPMRVNNHADWPECCCDIPPSNRVIVQGEPVCTIIISDTEPEMLEQKAFKAKQYIFKNCLNNA